MKTFKLLFTFLLSLLFGVISTLAQERVIIPLSNPGEPGELELGIIRGTINVSGADAQQVIINYNNGDHYTDDGDNTSQTRNGLRRISDNSIGFEVTEKDNKIEIGGASPKANVHFNISIPRNFSLSLSTVNGDIKVENVNGEMEISNVNGGVSLTNVSGSASVNTVNGAINASFNSINRDNPMAFSNVQGDIDITLPANASVTAKMKSEWGEVYTDFEMNIERSNQENIDVDSEVYKVSVNNWITGNINGGGPEYMFKTLRGDIYIRKQ